MTDYSTRRSPRSRRRSRRASSSVESDGDMITYHDRRPAQGARLFPQQQALAVAGSAIDHRRGVRPALIAWASATSLIDGAIAPFAPDGRCAARSRARGSRRRRSPSTGCAAMTPRLRPPHVGLEPLAAPPIARMPAARRARLGRARPGAEQQICGGRRSPADRDDLGRRHRRPGGSSGQAVQQAAQDDWDRWAESKVDGSATGTATARLSVREMIVGGESLTVWKPSGDEPNARVIGMEGAQLDMARPSG
jgi:hypothetical protein